MNSDNTGLEMTLSNYCLFSDCEQIANIVSEISKPDQDSTNEETNAQPDRTFTNRIVGKRFVQDLIGWLLLFGIYNAPLFIGEGGADRAGGASGSI